jgi:hypothetical protein
MSDNVYKDNKNRFSIMSSAGSGDTVIVLRQPRSPYFWVFAVLVGGLVTSLLFYVFLSLPRSGSNSNSNSNSKASNLNSAALLAKDVEFLKGQMNILITGAMESKIQQLEESIQSGILSGTELGTVQALKEDLKALKAYSVQNASMTLGLAGDADNRGAQSPSRASLYSDELLQEVSKIKSLFYISIASWGVAIVIFGGTWARGYYRLRQIQSERLYRHQLLEKPKTLY